MLGGGVLKAPSTDLAILPSRSTASMDPVLLPFIYLEIFLEDYFYVHQASYFSSPSGAVQNALNYSPGGEQKPCQSVDYTLCCSPEIQTSLRFSESHAPGLTGNSIITSFRMTQALEVPSALLYDNDGAQNSEC